MVYSGRVLLRAGRYETLRPIASGGMATVYLGRAVGAGGFERLVAIKIMHPHTASEPEFVAMFLDEARLAARVRHPNVVATIDLVEDPLFLVMEFIDGPSLHLLLRACRKARRPLPVGIALRIFLDMLAGLHAAHDLTGPDGEPLHLVHRDVSPQNVLVGGDGISRLTDFGVARAESRLSTTQGAGLKGKIGYMSPEQIRAQPVDRRSDVYSSGSVLWEMLTGKRLYSADNEAALITQMLAGPSGGPRTVAPDVPPEIDLACMRALEREPGDRYPSAAAFADGVEHAASAAGVEIASYRAVAALIQELDLRASAEELAPSSRAPGWTGGSASGGSGSGRASAAATPLPGSMHAAPRLGSLADLLEPSGGATGIGGVVSEPSRSRGLSGYRGLIVGGVAALAVAVGLVIAVSKLGGLGEAQGPPGGPPTAPARPAAVPPADATAIPEGGPIPTASAATSAGAAPAPTAPPAETATSLTPRVTAPSPAGPRAGSPGNQAKPSATNFRPTEL
jgi:serine/threonine-protein kinase